MKNFQLTALLLAITALPASASITAVEESVAQEVSTSLFINSSIEGHDDIDSKTYFNTLGKISDELDIYAMERGGDYFFTSGDGRYVFTGNVIDLKEGVSLKDEAVASVAKPTLANLTPQDYITFPSKLEGKKDILYVFSEATCGFCKKLHGQFEQLNSTGIEIRVVPFIRSLDRRLDEDYTIKTAEIMSIVDPIERRIAYKDLMENDNKKVGEFTLTENGYNKVQSGYMTGQKLGVSGTPMLMNVEGKLLNGAYPNEQIMSELF